LIRKWQTLIEAHTDVKTTDGYLVRLFVIAFTKKADRQVSLFSYAQSAQIKKIRKKITNAAMQVLQVPRIASQGTR